MQILLEHLGIAVAALTGVLAAKGKRIDLFGVLVLALVTSFGGGTVRDLIVGDLPVFWLQSPAFLFTATTVALLAFIAVRAWKIPVQGLLVADAFALGLFTMIGVSKGVSLGFEGSVAVLLGVVTGVAGGIIRDVLLGEVPLVFRPEIHLYATAAMCGGIVFTLLRLGPVPEPTAILIGFLLVLVLRLMGIKWRISLPLFKTAEPGMES